MTNPHEFRQAYGKFQSARGEMPEALKSNAKLTGPAKQIEKSVVVFIDFIRQPNPKRPSFDAEFRGRTPTQLGWEAVAVAERIVLQLDGIIRAGRESKVEVGFLMSLSALDSDLSRLQWLVKKLK